MDSDSFPPVKQMYLYLAILRSCPFWDGEVHSDHLKGCLLVTVTSNDRESKKVTLNHLVIKIHSYILGCPPSQ